MTTFIERWYYGLDQEMRYLFDERAAVYEYDANMPRYVAERRAQRFVCALIRKGKEGGK